MRRDRVTIAGTEFAFSYFLQSLHIPWLDSTMMFISFLGDHGRFFLLLVVILSLFKKARIMRIAMLFSVLLGFLIGNLWLRNMFMHQRPCWLDPTVDLLVRVPRDYSFPFGHMLIGFECAVSIWLQNRKAGVVMLVFAFLLAFSRMYLLVHFPTDVLAGAVLGSVIAWAVYRLMREIEKRRQLWVGGGLRLINYFVKWLQLSLLAFTVASIIEYYRGGFFLK